MATKVKWILVISLIFNLIFVLVFFLSEEDQSDWTYQNLANAIDVKVGTTSDQLISIMGNPIKKDAFQTREEWFYCKTGLGIDDFVQFTLLNDQVTKINNYTVSGAEAGGLSGSCELFIKRGGHALERE